MQSRTSDAPAPGPLLKRGRDILSLVDYSADRLRMLCVAAGFGRQSDDVTRTFRQLVSPWGDTRFGKPSKWLSEISDDNTPVEFSVAITDGRPEVRVLFEPHSDEPTLAAFRASGLAFNERLEREFGANLERFRLLQKLYLPEDMQGSFAIWSSAVFSPNRAPSFKAYFNPQACGSEHAESLVREGLNRVGLGRAWAALRDTALRRGPPLDELKYVALDLTSAPDARIKVYVRHHGATPEDLEIASSGAASYLAGEAYDFARSMRGGDARLHVRAPFTCSAFVAKCDNRPATTTVYVPACAYARDDAAVQRRVREYMSRKGLNTSQYDATISGFANRPLDAGVGMQSWIALRRQGPTARVSVYLATEANHVHAPGSVPAPTVNPAPPPTVAAWG